MILAEFVERFVIDNLFYICLTDGNVRIQETRCLSPKYYSSVVCGIGVYHDAVLIYINAWS